MNLITTSINAKPFLKWAGGKSQLMSAIEASLPQNISKKKELTYIEPFVGSGAVLFWFLKKYAVQQAVICDTNSRLIDTYRVIQKQPNDLINQLSMLQNHYQNLKTEEARRALFLEKRLIFNSSNDQLETAVLFIFLNKTCFNGLYRVNSRNGFNVPFGKYDNPKICDPLTILADSALLQKVTILRADYSETLQYATENTFFYFDPPYKPLSKTASFNTYTTDFFNDAEQERLAAFCQLAGQKGHNWLLSNSDLRNTEGENDYFDNLYADFNIQRVKAKRSINSDATKRGEINELLISNYPLSIQEEKRELVLF
jgi:DNA adenine methylase